MPWLNVTFAVEEDQLDSISEHLELAGAQSVTIEDAGDNPLFDLLDGEYPVWDRSLVTGLFNVQLGVDEVMAKLTRAFAPDALPECRVESLPEQDWERSWMDRFQPMQYGKNLWVCPTWYEPPDQEAINIMLDPGLAFGSGSHETTRLCMQWLSTQRLEGKAVIDYGCGSGILAIAALKSGAASALGVDIIERCDVQGFDITNGHVQAVETSRGRIEADRIGVAVAGHSSEVMRQANVRLPIESHVLQAFVTEGLKPVIPGVITYGAGHFYISQSDKGGLVFGGDLDGYNSYASRGNLPVVEDVCEGGMSIMPMLGRARLLRSWGGVMDMSMDGSPIIDRTQVNGLFFNGGWCYGGFKATPASGLVFAHLIATGSAHPTASAYRFDRFAAGAIIDEKGQGSTPNLH